MEDDDIRERLIARFPLCFDGNAAARLVSISVDKSVLGGGRYPHDWYVDLVEYVETQLREGKTVLAACNQFAATLPNRKGRTLSEDTVRQKYYELKNGDPHEEFCAAILDARIDDAIQLYKRLSLKSRKHWRV